MSITYADGAVTVYGEDCLAALRRMPDASVDAVVTDPPYGLEFMGKEWDTFKPAGKIAGFGVPDGSKFRRKVGTPSWGASGNPSCRNCGKSKYDSGDRRCRCDAPEFPNHMADQMRTFQQWSQNWAAECFRILKPGGHLLAFGGSRTAHRLACGVEDAGFEIRDGIDWLYATGFPKSLNLPNGMGTALKPAREPIVVARKPPAGTVVANIARHATGALNIDACRIPGRDRTDYGLATATRSQGATYDASLGRWPTNVILSHAPIVAGGQIVGDACTSGCVPGCPVVEMDQQSGASSSRAGKPRVGKPGNGWRTTATGAEYTDHGGASRFFPVFRFEAKAPGAERPFVGEVAHPTVKPLGLMRWLVRLVTPPGGLVVDPFLGSGTTAEACLVEGFRCIGMESNSDYLPLIDARLRKPMQAALDIFGGAA